MSAAAALDPDGDEVDGYGDWPKGVTASTAVRWSMREYAKFSVEYIAACHGRDTVEMEAALVGLKRIVTRLEAHARTQTRRWPTKEKKIAEAGD